MLNSLTAAGGSSRRTVGLLAVLLALALALSLSARAEALVYFGNDDRILRAGLNGAGAHPFISGADHPCGLAVNGNHVFWVNRGDPSAATISHIGRARLDGTQVNQKFIPNIGTEACGVAVNGTHIFWGTGFVQGVPGGGTIGRANLNGTGSDPAFIDNQMSDVCGVAVNSSFLYAVRNTAGQIRRFDLDGSPHAAYSNSASIPCGIAAGASFVFWANRGTGFIGRGNLVGFPVFDETFIDTNFGSPCGPAVNGTHVFWTDRLGVGRAGLDGSGVNLLFIRDPLAVPGTPSTYTSCGVAVDSLPVPAGAFKLGKLKLNKKKGFATLTVSTSWPGSVTAAGKGVKKAKRTAKGVGKVKLPIKAKGKAKRKLNRTGRARVRVKVRHAASGGKTSTKTRRVRLIKRG